MKVNGPGRSNLGQGRNIWQQRKHARLYSDLLQVFKGELTFTLHDVQVELLQGTNGQLPDVVVQQEAHHA